MAFANWQRRNEKCINRIVWFDVTACILLTFALWPARRLPVSAARDQMRSAPYQTIQEFFVSLTLVTVLLRPLVPVVHAAREEPAGSPAGAMHERN
jgi:hypothetical protein